MNKVQEALEAAIEYIESTDYEKRAIDVLKLCKSALADIAKCEPVAEALHERNRLGYAVVDVIGTLDEIIENAQEVEVDDFLHIAIPIDKWHELQDALEEMPKRAELYTSPISKEREGWVSVPIEPTEEMLKAGCEAGLDFKTLMDDAPYSTDLAVYKAMINQYINE